MTVVGKLRPLLSERRARRIEAVLEGRLNGIAVLLEQLYDHGNIVAIMRTCEALGVQHVHLVDGGDKFKPAKKIGQGADKWLSIAAHRDVESAVRALRDVGYRLVAADPEAPHTLEEIPLDGRVAVAFGSERDGLSPALKAKCDDLYRIPMTGYTQSLNVSCAAAVTLFDLTTRYRREIGRPGDLSDEEKAAVRSLFYRRSVRRSDLLLE